MAVKNRLHTNNSLAKLTPSPNRFSDIFIGRENEMRQLIDYLEKAQKGCGSFIIVSGEAGTGKTRLIREFAAHAQRAGANIIVESFLGASVYDPYLPFRKIVERLKIQADEESNAGVGAQPAQDSPLFLDVSSNNFEIKSLYSLQTNHRIAQQRIINALFKAAAHELQFIVLMDVHLASITAWQFIHYLSESISEYKMLLIVTLRQDGREIRPGKIPVYSEVLQRMNRERLINRVQLQRYDEETIRRLLTMIFQSMDFSSRLSRLLFEVTGGLPGQVFRCLDVMQEKGLIYQQDGIWFNADDITQDSLLKLLNLEYAESDVTREFEQLPQNQKEILKYAALFCTGSLEMREF